MTNLRFSLLVVLTVVGMQLHAGTTTITVRGLAAKAERALKGSDTLTENDVVLYHRLDVPSVTGLTVTMNILTRKPLVRSPKDTSLTPTSTIRRIGSLGGKPVAGVSIKPYQVIGDRLQASSFRLYVVDEVELVVSWSDARAVELPKLMVVQNSWYDPSKPYARLRTADDGVAVIRGEDVIALGPEFTNLPVNEVALLWKGAEQHVAIFDNDDNSVISAGDSILFQGRRAQGDSTYYDMDDSVSVFFLTRSTDGERLRLRKAESVGSQQRITSVVLNERVEFDTGYYHLGYSPAGDIYSEYNSDLVWLEGFYWARLVASAYEKITHRQMLTPAPNGSATISMNYIGSSVSHYNPDTRVDLTVNGTERVFLETDVVDKYSMQLTIPSNRLVSGLQSFKMFATGIDSLRQYRDYKSEVLLDAYTIRADVLPILDSGRMRCTIGPSAQPSDVSFANARGTGYAIDTVNHEYFFLANAEPNRLIRSGLSPRDRGWITDDVPTNAWRASASIDDATLDIDSIAAFGLVVIDSVSNDIQLRSFSNGDDLADALDALKTYTPCVVINAGGTMTNDLRSAMSRLNNRGNPVPTEPYWCINSIINVISTTGASTQLSACGSTLSHSLPQSQRNSVRTALPVSGERVVFVADQQGIERARVEKAYLRNLASATDQTDVIMVTQKTHWKEAERLAAHRRLHSNVRVRIVDIDDILDEFGTGHRSAQALRDYLAHAYESAAEPKPRYVMLFGAASWDARLAVKNGNVGARLPDQIPTYGRPSSDYFYSMLDDPTDHAVPEVIVGRIPATTEADGKAIVDKIIHNDTISYDPWQRKWMFVGGGSENEDLCQVYEDMLGDPSGTGFTYTDPPMCMDTVTLCKYKAPSNAGYYLKLNIDQGLQWMNYIGHGAPDQFDITGWDPSELSNNGKYGVLATYACQTGAFSNPSKPCKNAQYLTEPNRGFVAAMGGTGWEFTGIISFLHYNIHEAMRDTSVSPMFRKIGDIMYEAKVVFALNGDQFGINTVMQYCLLGDPMMKIHMDTLTDVLVRKQDVIITSLDGSAELTDSDTTALLSVTLQNRGLGTEIPFLVTVKHSFGTTTETFQQTVNGICIREHLEFPLHVLDMPGDHILEVTADPEAVFSDNKSDNTVQITFTVLPRSLLPLEPVAHGFIHKQAFHVRVLDPLTEPGIPHFAICTDRLRTDESILMQSSPDDVSRDYSIIDWHINQPVSLPDGPAWLAAWMVLDASQTETAVMWLPIMINADNGTQTAEIDAIRMTTPTPNSVMYDEFNDVQRLRSITRDIYVRSSGLNTPDIFVEPVLEFRVGDVSYVKNPFFRGINIMLVSENDTVPHTIRRYDTYWDPLPTSTGHNGYTRELFTFLRDSVGITDRVCFASCNEAFTGFFEQKNIDTLIEILHSYGSRFADSLDTNSSWAMIGRRGLAPGEAAELWKGKPDSLVTLIEPEKFYSKTGTVNSGWIGPSRRWEKVELVNAQRGIHASVSGRRRNGMIEVLQDLSDTSSVWTPTEADSDLVFVSVTWTLDYVAFDTTAATVSAVRAQFTPAHEWIIEPQPVSLQPFDVLRGDSVVLSFEVRNADRHALAPASIISVDVPGATSGSIAYHTDVNTGDVTTNEKFLCSISLPTDAAASTGDVVIHFDPNRTRSQFYTFNDRRTTPFTIREDDAPPVLQALADSVIVDGVAYVIPAPLIEILLRDNSRLPINDSSRLVVFVNGDRIKASNTEDYEWLPSTLCAERYTDSSIRAAIKFRYPLDLGQNNLIVRASDATGNTAELEAQLWTTDRTEIASITPSPTPTDGPVTFYIELHSNMSKARANLSIFDINGRHISDLSGEVSVGKTSLHWDGKSGDGSSLPSGIYVYRLSLADADGTGLTAIHGNVMILH